MSGGAVRRAVRHPAAGPLYAVAGGIAGGAYLYRTDPHEPGHWLPRCPFNWATGLLCPLCGATRTAYDLLHAEPVRAFHDNALLVLCVPLLLAAFGGWAWAALRGRRWRVRVGPRGTAALVVVLVAWGVVRNLR